MCLNVLQWKGIMPTGEHEKQEGAEAQHQNLLGYNFPQYIFFYQQATAASSIKLFWKAIFKILYLLNVIILKTLVE